MSPLNPSPQTPPVRVEGKALFPEALHPPSLLGVPSWDGNFQAGKGFLKLLLGPWAKPAPKKNADPKGNDQRTAPRFSLHSRVMAYFLRPNASPQPFWGGVKNLSQKGVCIETAEPLTMSHVILLDFKTAGKKRFNAAAKVVWSRDRVSGLEFLEPLKMEDLLNYR